MAEAPKTCVFIPAFNEEDTVGSVVQRVREQVPEATVVVVNDGSTDATVARAEAAGAFVLDVPFNLGIGGAVQTGLKFAYRGGYDVAVEIDADGQHDPRHLRQLIAGLGEASSVDMVIGSRFVVNKSYRASPLRSFGIHTFSFLIKFVTRKRVYDSTSGYRAYSRDALRFLSRRYPTDFPEPESIVMLLSHGFDIREVPVQMGQRAAGVSVVGRDMSFRAAYFVLSNAIAILATGIKVRNV